MRKRPRRITFAEAKVMVTENKDKTEFFDGSCNVNRLYDRLIKGFTDEETKVIIAALRLAGANFNYE